MKARCTGETVASLVAHRPRRRDGRRGALTSMRWIAAAASRSPVPASAKTRRQRTWPVGLQAHGAPVAPQRACPQGWPACSSQSQPGSRDMRQRWQVMVTLGRLRARSRLGRPHALVDGARRSDGVRCWIVGLRGHGQGNARGAEPGLEVRPQALELGDEGVNPRRAVHRARIRRRPPVESAHVLEPAPPDCDRRPKSRASIVLQSAPILGAPAAGKKMAGDM
jgi:hypothetical protein